MINAQQLADARPGGGPRHAAEGNEGIEVGAVEDAHARRRDLQQAGVLEDGEIEHPIADRDAGARARVAGAGEDAVGKVVQRKMRLGGDLDERTRRHAGRGHQGLPVKCLARPCQQSR
jgi:hypothetical protein